MTLISINPFREDITPNFHQEVFQECYLSAKVFGTEVGSIFDPNSEKVMFTADHEIITALK
jgi:hypothetical protein